MGTKHPVPGQVKTSRPERQSARISKITNDSFYSGMTM